MSRAPETSSVFQIRDLGPEPFLEELPEGVAVVLLRQNRHGTPSRTMGSSLRSTKTEEVEQLVYDAFVLHAGIADGTAPVGWVPLGPVAPIDSAVSAWREYIVREGSEYARRGPSRTKPPVHASRNMVASPATRLRELVWNKLEPRLNGCTTVVFIPDGQLVSVPWSALPGQEPGSYLVEQYRFATVAYPHQLHALLVRESPAGTRLTIAGGIDYDQQPLAVSSPHFHQTVSSNVEGALVQRSGRRLSWALLPGTGREVSAIADLHTRAVQGPSSVFRGRRAHEWDVATSMADSRYIHLATHGFFEQADTHQVYDHDLRDLQVFQNPLMARLDSATLGGRNPLLLSGVVFAGANLPTETDALGLPKGDDGILTAEEIVGLNLWKSELVTLSACESALGELSRAGGSVFGLQQAFHRAGVRSVVASLWSVDDRATAAFMTEFYRNLWERKVGKLEALYRAQRIDHDAIQSSDRRTCRARSPKRTLTCVLLGSLHAKRRLAIGGSPCEVGNATTSQPTIC